MSANPSLVVALNEELLPAPFLGESLLLKKPGVLLELDGLRTATGKWSARGTLFLSNIRLVFTSTDKPDASGLTAFDFPLVYIRGDVLNQPIFTCNNLKGEVWPATEGGGPEGSLPPHKFTIYFKEGGIGTFYPLYYTLVERAKQAFAQSQGSPMPGWRDPNPSGFAESLAARAYVDPSDPSTVYLVQPTDENQRLLERPVYAANYGKDEDAYEDMAPGHGRPRE